MLNNVANGTYAIASGTFDYNPATSTVTYVNIAVTVNSGEAAGTYYVQNYGGNSSIYSVVGYSSPFIDIDLAENNNGNNRGIHSTGGLCMDIVFPTLPMSSGTYISTYSCSGTFRSPPSGFVYVCGGTGCAFDNLTAGTVAITGRTKIKARLLSVALISSVHTRVAEITLLPPHLFGFQ
jgi:hypothetical protein